MITPNPGNGDRQKSQTELEMEAARRNAERRNERLYGPSKKPNGAAQPTAPLKKTNSVANVLPFDPTPFPKRPEGIELFPEGIESLFPEGIESLFPKKTPTKPIESVVPRVAGADAPNVGISTPADQQREQQRLNDQAKQGGTS